jgi:hypothetical protein
LLFKIQEVKMLAEGKYMKSILKITIFCFVFVGFLGAPALAVKDKAGAASAHEEQSSSVGETGEEDAPDCAVGSDSVHARGVNADAAEGHAAGGSHQSGKAK